MDKSRKRFFVELTVAGSAVIISLCALIVSYKQVAMMEEQMHLSVLPRLSIGLSISPYKGDFSLTISNNGIGPAEILNTEIRVDNIVAKNWNQVFNMIDSSKGDYTPNSTTTKLNDILLGKGSHHAMIIFNDTTWSKVLQTERSRISVKVSYKSLYNDHFEVIRESLGVSGAVENKKTEGNTISEENAFLLKKDIND